MTRAEAITRLESNLKVNEFLKNIIEKKFSVRDIEMHAIGVVEILHNANCVIDPLNAWDLLLQDDQETQLHLETIETSMITKLNNIIIDLCKMSGNNPERVAKALIEVYEKEVIR